MGFNLKYIVHLNELLNNNLSEIWECANEKMGVIFWWKSANEILRCEKQHVGISIKVLLRVQQKWMLKRFLFSLIRIVTFVLFEETKIMTWMISSDDMEIEIYMFEKFYFIQSI